MRACMVCLCMRACGSSPAYVTQYNFFNLSLFYEHSHKTLTCGYIMALPPSNTAYAILFFLYEYEGSTIKDNILVNYLV